MDPHARQSHNSLIILIFFFLLNWIRTPEILHTTISSLSHKSQLQKEGHRQGLSLVSKY